MLANDMGIDAIAALHEAVRLRRDAPASTCEGESTGVLPSPEWKLRRFRKPEQQKWYAGETISIGIGQGYNAYTPIQLAQAMATLAATAACTGRASSRTSTTRAPASGARSSPSWCSACRSSPSTSSS